MASDVAYTDGRTTCKDSTPDDKDFYGVYKISYFIQASIRMQEKRVSYTGMCDAHSCHLDHNFLC